MGLIGNLIMIIQAAVQAVQGSQLDTLSCMHAAPFSIAWLLVKICDVILDSDGKLVFVIPCIANLSFNQMCMLPYQ